MQLYTYHGAKTFGERKLERWGICFAYGDVYGKLCGWKFIVDLRGFCAFFTRQSTLHVWCFPVE